MPFVRRSLSDAHDSVPGPGRIGFASRVAQLHQEGELRFAVAGTVGNWIARAAGGASAVPVVALNPLRFIDWHHRSLDTAPAFVDTLLALYPRTKRVVDFGCGTGAYVSELRLRQVEVVGYERSRYARHVARRVFGLQLERFDIERFDGRDATYDVCLCLELAHYLPPAPATALVSHCARASRFVAFSVPPSSHGGTDRWIAAFAAVGMQFRQAETKEFSARLQRHLKRNTWLADHLRLFSR
jgi:SAM-dependent methyltransferase